MAASTAGTSRRVGARKEAIAGYGMVAIPMLFFLVLQIGVLFYAAFISLWNWNLRSGPVDFIGLRNFERLVSDPIFLTAVKNSLYYCMVWVPLTMAVGLFLAVIVNQKIRGQTFFRAAFYFPAIASSAAITILWIFLVAPSGLFNEIRGVMGLNPLFEFLGYGAKHNWIGDYRTALNSVIILNAWTTSGTFMLFYLASLQSISNEVYEAAAIDGAGPWQAFWKITFPLLKPGHFFVATVGVIGGLQLFDQVRIAGTASGAPANSLMTIVLYLYNALITQINPGYAAAVGIVLFVIILGATLIQRRLFGGAPSW
ncbi:MAG TPA: sugar ABC transporter permease [Candidatus Limnocylindrales bacterium]|jgi:multiple sugar transport system permease protein|nr:sugar ABC transporter permease [Candidatus Limnocylindrales bacterium]